MICSRLRYHDSPIHFCHQLGMCSPCTSYIGRFPLHLDLETVKRRRRAREGWFKVLVQRKTNNSLEDNYCANKTKQKKAYLAETTNITFRCICTNNFISFWTSSATQIMNVSVCEETYFAWCAVVSCNKWICQVIRHELSGRTTSKTSSGFQIAIGF